MHLTRTALASLLLASLLVLSSSASAARPFAPEDLLRLRLVVEARISPDGTTTAYVVAEPRDPFADEDGTPRLALHVLGPQAGRSRVFVDRAESLSAIAWIPDGRGISFLSKRAGDEKQALYVIPVDGGEARRILSHESGVSEYALLPGGKQVAFLARDPEAPARKKRTDKGFDAEAYEEAPRFVRVFVAPLKADGAADEPRQLQLEGSASKLRASPDGKLLAVALAPSPGIDDVMMKSRVHIVQVADGAVVGKVATEGKLGEVVWSPDSELLVLLAGAHANDPDASRLMVVPATGGAPKDLLPGLEGDVRAVAFDGKRSVVHIVHRGVETYLARIPADGEAKDVEVMLEPGAVALRSLSLSADGARGVLVGDTAGYPYELHGYQRGATALQRLTRSNPWLDEVQLGAQEVVRYTARDGQSIEGLLVKPLDGVPKGGAPLVVFVHGGPEAHYSNGWLTRYVRPAQILAARGFAAFFPNYRGSTGRGVRFCMAGQGDYAGREFDDVVDGVKHLAAQGLVDPKRVGLTGGSYGGYAAAWAATALSEHFRASVMFVGVSDLVSKFGTTDIPNEMFLSHARAWPWEKPTLYQERSPIFHAHKHRTPLLILHGKQDPRVHPSQSLIMYRYLKTLGQAPVRLVWYPREGHGNRRAAARYDYALRLVRWMERYVTGPGGEPPAFELPPVEQRLQEAEKKAEDKTGDGGPAAPGGGQPSPSRVAQPAAVAPTPGALGPAAPPASAPAPAAPAPPTPSGR